MRILLDTHALLWIVNGDQVLSKPAIEAYLSADEVYWSIVSFWEISVKLSLKKRDFKMASDWTRTITTALANDGIRHLALKTEHCEILGTLPWYHRDPFDRTLIAQAVHEQLTVISRDQLLVRYPISVIW
jgi:PIN domain nuclease of toxin-antitoxin system